MMRLTFALAVLLAGPILAHATPGVGGPLPRLTISGDDSGTLVIRGDDIAYRRFDSGAAVPGTPKIVIYLAARSKARDMSNALKAELKRVRLGRARYGIVTIVDFDDCVFGTCGIASGRLSTKKKARPWVHYVADEDGVGRVRWGLKAESFTAFVTDAAGTIVRVHEGPMSPEQARAFVSALAKQLKP